MAIVARGRIADTGEDTFTLSMHHDYILADEQGFEILYLLQGDSDYIGATRDLACSTDCVCEARGQAGRGHSLGGCSGDD
jgi:hypothetical protein